MVAALGQNQIRPAPSRQDIVAQIWNVDLVPGPETEFLGLVGGHLGEAVKKALRVGEGSFAQRAEADHEPVAEVRLVGVDIDREIDEVRGEEQRPAAAAELAGLQNVQSLDDQDVGTIDRDELARNDIVDEVRIDRHLDVGLAGLDVGEERDQRGAVIAFGKAFAVGEAAFVELGIGQQKPVGRHEVDLR